MDDDQSFKPLYPAAEKDGVVYVIDHQKKIANVFRITKESVLIPRYVVDNSQEYLITNFFKSALTFNYFIQKIEFADDSEIKIIDNNGFSNSSIESITLPKNLMELQKDCFKSTRSLFKINITPNNNYYKVYNDKFLIGKSSTEKEDYNVLIFAPRNIEKVKLPSFIEIIAPYAFEYCENLKKFEIPSDSKLTKIGKSAFYNTKIENFTIPVNFIEFQNGWCNGTRKLKSINVAPDNNYYKVYDDKFLIGKSSPEKDIFDILIFAPRDIETATIPKFIETIAPYAFNECECLHQVTIPHDSNLKIIGKHAFSKSSIESIQIPHHVTKIGKAAFSYCKQLRQVEIPANSNLQKIEEYTFYGTKIESISIPCKVVEIGKNAFYGCSQLQHVEIAPNSVLQIIEENAFYEVQVESLSLPEKLTELREGWCNGALQLKKIKIDQNNNCYSLYNDQFIVGKSSFEKRKFDVLVFAPRDIEKATIPSFIEIIGSCAFNACKKLRYVEFPFDSNLRIIEDRAFSDSSIKCISIPRQVTRIGRGAFFYCKNLNKVEIPNNSELRIIEQRAFFNSSIERIFIPQHIKRICGSTFSDCVLLRNVDFSKNSELQVIEDYAFYNTSIESISIPRHTTNIVCYAFSLCSNLQIFELDKNSEIEYIDDFAFKDSKNITFMTPIKFQKYIKGFII